MTKKSYVLIGDPRGKNLSSNQYTNFQKNLPNLSGLYLWSEAFKEHGSSGTIDTIWNIDELEKYDIVHINYTPSNIQLPSIIRDELTTFQNTSTKLVINVDIDVSRWGANWAYQFHNLFREVQLADHIFHVEPVGAGILSGAIHRSVTTLPHPVDVSKLYDMISIDREPMIATIYHRYNAETMIPYLAQKDIGIARVLFGYTPGKHQYVANAGMFHDIFTYTNFQDHILNLSQAGFGCDLYDGFTYGRSVVEFAALAIPAVVSNTIYASKYLYPYTSIYPYDVREARELFTKLVTDEEFSNDLVIPTANERLPYYGLKQRYDKFIEMIEEEK